MAWDFCNQTLKGEVSREVQESIEPIARSQRGETKGGQTLTFDIAMEAMRKAGLAYIIDHVVVPRLARIGLRRQK